VRAFWISSKYGVSAIAIQQAVKASFQAAQLNSMAMSRSGRCDAVG
jgi:hypothetical protein